MQRLSPGGQGLDQQQANVVVLEPGVALAQRPGGASPCGLSALPTSMSRLRCLRRRRPHTPGRVPAAAAPRRVACPDVAGWPAASLMTPLLQRQTAPLFLVRGCRMWCGQALSSALVIGGV